MICPYEQYAKPLGSFCEENLCTYITQPANSWSNLAYIIIGIYLIFVSQKNSSWFLRVMGPISILIGLSSFIYHATYTLWSEFIDLSSMLLLTSYLLAYNLSRLKPKLLDKYILIFLTLGLFSINLVILYTTKFTGGFEWGKYIFGFEVFVILFLEYFIYRLSKNTYSLKNLSLAVVILFVAWIVWLLDRTKVWCVPNTFHYINGHVVWHILTSISLIFTYYFYQQLSQAKKDRGNKN